MGFEVLEDNDDSVVLKRVISSKGKKKEDVTKIELGLPKVTIHYFNENDFNVLKEIENDLYHVYLQNMPSKTLKKRILELFQK
jgi:hypothetical protein